MPALPTLVARDPTARDRRVSVPAGPTSYPAAPSGHRAPAGPVDPNGSPFGSASFVEQRQNVRIEITVIKLPPGTHGVHLHAVGTCAGPDFGSAGPHFNPTGAVHGIANPKGPHAGDLPNLEVQSDGRGTLAALPSLADLAPGASPSPPRPGGPARVRHRPADDQRPEPPGNSGARIACGVIKKVG